MKLCRILFVVVCAMMFSSSLKAQGITPPAPGKSVVYFVRTSAFGFAINFTFFDSTKFVAKFNGTKYVRYECEPGKHLFWARSENREFIEAELEEGKVYFIEAYAGMGAIKASVQLDPLLPTDMNQMKAAIELINKKPSVKYTEAELMAEQASMQDVIGRGLAKYETEKVKGKKAQVVRREDYYPIQ